MTKTIIGRLRENPVLLNPMSSRTMRVGFTITRAVYDSDNNVYFESYKIIVFGKQAQSCLDALHKGELACVEGRCRTKRYSFYGEGRQRDFIECEKLTFLTPVHRRKESAAVSEAV